jgi:hypothetical protein
LNEKTSSCSRPATWSATGSHHPPLPLFFPREKQPVQSGDLRVVCWQWWWWHYFRQLCCFWQSPKFIVDCASFYGSIFVDIENAIIFEAFDHLSKIYD